MERAEDDERLIDAKQVGERAGVARATIYKWAELGLLPCYRMGSTVRFKLSDVRTFIESHRHSGAGVTP